MKETSRASVWLPVLDRKAGPLYLAIADAIAAARAAGTLAAGARLPPQRTLAEALGIDFTTVSRAYAEARKRGLVEGRVGQGTYVRPGSRAAAPSAPDLVDRSMNLPPRFDDPALCARLWEGIGTLEQSGGLDLLLRYQQAGGTLRDRAAGAQWLAPRLPSLTGEQILVAPGAQTALLAVTSLVAQPGDTICTGVLTYPGFRALAAHAGLRLAGVAMDADGLDPDAFDALCRTAAPKALYCTPTLQNPTTATMPETRRRALIAAARKHGVPIIEDDAYGVLPSKAPPPLAALAPELTYHVAGLSKCLSPALRIAYAAAPGARETARLASALRAAATMASPLTAAIATRWIETGLAEAVRNAIRKEGALRQKMAAYLVPHGLCAHPEGFHAWLTLPAPWTRGEFILRLRMGAAHPDDRNAFGLGIVASDAFALDRPPEAVRLALGAPASGDELERGLQRIARLLEQPPALSSAVI